MTLRIFRGSPRLLIGALPWALGVLALKVLAHALGTEPLEVNTLLAGAIGAEVFILGFLLSGTAADFKEAERLPGEIAASLETIADECLIVHRLHGEPAARRCLEQLIEISSSVRLWLLQTREFDEVMSEVGALNGPFAVMSPLAQTIVRIKTEQAAVRRTVMRMDTVRRTSYVAAGYLIAEVTAVLLMAVLVLTDLGQLAPTLYLVGLLTYLLLYLVGLIRDLDNPFEYIDGRPGAADVDLGVLERSESRLRALLGALEPEAQPEAGPADLTA